MFAVPVILESESQNRSTAFPLIVDRRLLEFPTSMLELLIATRSPCVPCESRLKPTGNSRREEPPQDSGDSTPGRSGCQLSTSPKPLNLQGFRFIHVQTCLVELRYRSNRNSGITVDPRVLPFLNCQQGVV